MVAAEGKDQVEAAIISRLDENWQPVAGTKQRVAVDTIVTGYGFVPATELARLAGCEHDYRLEWGGWVPVRNGLMQGTRAGIYVVGDAAGISGASAARLEGRIAGLDVSRQVCEIGDTDKAMGAAQQALARERRFGGLLAEAFTPGAGLDSLATDEVVICRCQDVTLGQIKAALSEGARTMGEVKGLTCAGMGNCQGRICGTVLPRLVTRHLALMGVPSRAAPEPLTVRPPIHPLPLALLAELL